MNIPESRLNRWLDGLTNFMLLNILWLLVCIPVITIFPATAALFAVVRDWIRERDKGIIKPFFRYMRENFAQSMIVGIIWIIAGLVLVADFLYVRTVTSWARLPLLALLILFVVIYLGTAVNLFPVMVHFHVRWVDIIRNSFIIAIGSPVKTVLSLIIVTLAGLVLYVFPISFLIIGSVTAYYLYYLCHGLFQGIGVNDDESVHHSED